ncbi:MAG: hypothetical protein IJZ46_04390 [Bacilli bacterium]|nr:hypothetical protein [Bacilli bacterium]
MLSYEGIFFEANMVDLIHSLETEKLARVNDEIHCTFKYHPTTDEIFNDIVGRTFEVYLISYGNDGQNSGFEVLLPDELKAYYINYDATPHITASLAEEAKASNTKNLNFKPLEKPVKLVGRFGYWIKGENEEYLSYEPYSKGKTR